VKKFLVLIEKWMFPFLISASLILFVLTIYEKQNAGLADNPFEAAVQALTLDSTESGFTLYMNFTINLTLAWTVLKVLMASAGLKFDNLTAKIFSRNHIVIVLKPDSSPHGGSNHKIRNLPLALDLATAITSTKNVILTVPEIDEHDRTRMWDQGVKVITYNGGFEGMLKATRASEANALISICDNWLDNITICRAALSPALKNPSLQVKCMIESLERNRSFNSEEYFENSSLSRLRTFNESEMLARKMFSEFPADSIVAQTNKRVHVLMFGLTSVSEALILQLARLGHYRSGQKPKVSIVDSNLDTKMHSIINSVPAINNLLEINLVERSAGELKLKDIIEIINNKDRVTIAYVCGINEIENLRIARMLLSEVAYGPNLHKEKSFDVVALDPPGGIVLSDFYIYGEHAGKFHLFSLVGQDGSTEKSIIANSFLGDLDDFIGRSLHDAYLKKDLQLLEQNPKHKIHPNSVAWENLPENIRNANRAVADHFDIKMRAVGCKVVQEGCGIEAKLSPNEIEILAIMEHQRWWADRSLNGWELAEVRDDTNCFHPNMVPYEELSNADKQKDRDSVLQMIEVLGSDCMILVKNEV
jgi:hypothetical protein